jgi:glycine/D-amino acid oxidase-like deaminating enzyme
MQEGRVSFWYGDMGEPGGPPARRPSLRGEARADVAIVGAGYTGLWTAWALKAAEPGLEVAILERAFAGFGASGRNGGWLSGGFAWSHDTYAARSGRDAVWDMVRAMAGTVDAVIAVAEAEGIDADIHRTDELLVATNAAQWARAEAELARRRTWGEDADRLGLIGAEALAARVAIPDARGALVLRGVARVQPAKLVRGLAAAVERRGVRIFEDTEVTVIAPGRVETRAGTLRAPVVLRATEGFTAALPGHRRYWLPLNSAQIVTEPLPEAVWREIGWEGGELVGDLAHAYCYCQRTREGRIAFGGRGTPYRFGSALDRDGRPDSATIAWLTEGLHRRFPAAREARIEHAWCGVLGVPRDWCATVGFDREQGIGWAGGYVGVGVSTAHLAGHTLADLALGRDTPRTRLPWVGHRVRRWEPEPLRWLGVRGLNALLRAADRAEARGSATAPRLAAAASRIMGR